MRVRFWLMRYGAWRFGWIVRYLPSGEAEIIADDGARCYLWHGAVEGYERLWES